jgi:chromosome partitioning protein
MAKRISIINFKGGVGKTTLAFNLAAGLAKYHQPCRVLLVDVDHQSSLSIVCLGGIEWQKVAQDGRTINGIFETFVGQRRDMPTGEIICRNPLGLQHQSWRYINPGSPYRYLDLVPASLQLDDIEIELTASHHGNAIQSEWNKRTLICRWIEETGIDGEYDYIIFDCPPATKIVSKCDFCKSWIYSPGRSRGCDGTRRASPV